MAKAATKFHNCRINGSVAEFGEAVATDAGSTSDSPSHPPAVEVTGLGRLGLPAQADAEI
jgi:hypothetical protein